MPDKKQQKPYRKIEHEDANTGVPKMVKRGLSEQEVGNIRGKTANHQRGKGQESPPTLERENRCRVRKGEWHIKGYALEW